MEEEIERILNVTNYQDHPKNNSYKVFHYSIKDQAQFFEELLNRDNIKYEKDEELTKGTMLYLFGIHKTDLNKVLKLNYLAIGKYRKPFIANNILKWLILLVGFCILAIAIIGYIMNN